MNLNFSSYLGDNINNTIKNTFKNMNNNDIIFLSNLLTRMIDILAICFNFDYDNLLFINQLKQNNFRDLKWLLLMLLPYINEQENFNNITSIEDIYLKKYKDVNFKDELPIYKYSNIQFNLFDRKNFKENKNFKDLIINNFYFILDSIKTISNKMFVNWIDILPISFFEIEKTKVYINTIKIFNNKSLRDWDPYIDANLDIKNELIYKNLKEIGSCLSVEDIYNIISIEYYESIKSIKWLIYDIPYNNEILPFIVLINTVFELNNSINKNIRWNDLEDKNKLYFTNTWNDFVNSYINNLKLSIKNYTFKIDFIKRFLRGIILSFDKLTHHFDESIKEGYISVEGLKLTSITFENIIPCIKSVKAKFIYEFIYDSMIMFKNTPYNKGYLIDPVDETLYSGIEDYIKNINRKNISSKNIYNFSKSLTHYTKDKRYLRYPLYWKSLIKEEKDEILKRLNNKYSNPISWFNISRYIIYIVGKIDRVEIQKINLSIYKIIMTNLIDYVFSALALKGVLSIYVPNPLKTNEILCKRELIYTKQEDIINKYKDPNQSVYIYHFLKNTNYYILDKEEDFFNSLINKDVLWYTSFTYEWISQINIVLKILNNRVIFVTGSTGVGKSTEMAKLFLYYPLAIWQRKINKIVCSQPRKAPTERNADYVSKTLLTPLKKDYYVQLRHSDSKITRRVRHSYLEYMTDGTLINIVKNNYLMKIKRGDSYSNENLYDIIMIDESHEHKLNMDLLLTLLKIPITLNNKLTLIILSATMEEDESRYRYFFRDINDNLKYPLDETIKINLLDRISIDRRLHISPPGITTKFNIVEYYRPNNTIIEIINEIINNSDNGDILVFETGLLEINILINEINPLLPKNILAIPYYSNLSTELRNLVEKIDTRRDEIKMNKDDDFKNYNNGDNKYTRFIIVSTNIAEASITLSSLKYVIETGTQKISYYDYEKRSESLIKVNISESSRIQRKGRVGRKSSGYVYYLYEKDFLKNNKVKYEISMLNLTLNLFDLLRSFNDNDEIIKQDNLDPNYIFFDLEKINLLPLWLIELINDQYFNNNKFYNYYGNKKLYDYENYNFLIKFYKTGFDYNTLNDINGKFYIIHPDENIIERNFKFEIINLKNINKKMLEFWNLNKGYGYIKMLKDNSNYVYKTDLGSLISELSIKLKIENHNLFRSIIYGYLIGIGDDMLILYVSLIINNFNNLLFVESKEYIKYYIKRFNFTSDSETILFIVKEFLDFIKRFEIDYSSKGVNKILQKYNCIDNKYNIKSDYEDNFEESLTILETKNIEYIIKNFSKEMEKYCNIKKLNYNFFITFLEKFVKYKILFDKNINKEFLTRLDEFKDQIIINKNENKIITSLLFGYPFNIAMKYKDNYISLYTPLEKNIYNIDSYYLYGNQNYNTFINEMYLSKYILYLGMKIEDNLIVNITYLSKDLVNSIKNIYNKDNCSKYLKDNSSEIIKFIEKIDLFFN